MVSWEREFEFDFGGIAFSWCFPWNVRTSGFFSLTLTMDSREGNDEDEEEEDEGNRRFKGSDGPKLGVLTTN